MWKSFIFFLLLRFYVKSNGNFEAFKILYFGNFSSKQRQHLLQTFWWNYLKCLIFTWNQSSTVWKLRKSHILAKISWKQIIYRISDLYENHRGGEFGKDSNQVLPWQSWIAFILLEHQTLRKCIIFTFLPQFLEDGHIHFTFLFVEFTLFLFESIIV